MKILKNLKIDIYADGASKYNVEKLSKLDYIDGFTTNPSLMRSEGVENYVSHSLELLKLANKKPMSFEVLTDNMTEMYNQALKISEWGDNVFVKIPIVNSLGESTKDVIEKLASKSVNLNITAVFTIEQVKESIDACFGSPNSIISVFAGRIADTGVDPEEIISRSVELVSDSKSNSKILWASSREIFNIFQADRSGADIITVSHDLLNKVNTISKDLMQYSIETAEMFINDAKNAKYNFDNK